MKLIADNFKDKRNANMFIMFLKYLSFIGKKNILYQIDKQLIINNIEKINTFNNNVKPIAIVNICNLTYNNNINVIDWEEYLFKITINKTRKEILQDFLNKHNALTKFNDNIKLHSKYENIDELLNDNKNIETSIDYAFTWSSTKQGFFYWDKLDGFMHFYMEDIKRIIDNKLMKIINN